MCLHDDGIMYLSLSEKSPFDTRKREYAFILELKNSP